MKKIILCLFLPLILTGCKIELNIFSNDEDDKVVSLSGNFDCTNNPGSSDCVQEYQANIADCDGYDANDTAKDEWSELPNCTQLETTATQDEYLVAVPDDGNDFDGWGNFCWVGASFCQLTIEGDADPQSEVVVEASFGSEMTPQDVSYTYDAMGRRASLTRTVNGNSTTTYFIYDLDSHLIGEYNSDGTPIREYVYVEGQLLAQYDYTQDAQNPVQNYAFNDHLGTTVLMFNRNMQQTYDLETGPFGERYGEFQTVGTTQPLRNGNWQYDDSYRAVVNGQTVTYGNGYYDNWNRMYDSGTGRYLESDPIGLLRDYSAPELQIAIEIDGLEETGLSGEEINHLYGYVGQNPINLIDPYGLDTIRAKLMSAIGRGDTRQIKELMDAISDPKLRKAAEDALEKFGTKADDWIQQKCKGSINNEFPDELRDKTLEEIRKGSGANYNKAWKLLNDSRFQK